MSNEIASELYPGISNANPYSLYLLSSWFHLTSNSIFVIYGTPFFQASTLIKLNPIML